MLKEELRQLHERIKHLLHEDKEDQNNHEMNKYLDKLQRRIDDFAKEKEIEAIRQRNKIKVKITNVKRFILSHLKKL